MITSEIRSVRQTYTRSASLHATVCGTYPAAHQCARDRAHWETFEGTDLPEYLSEGVVKVSKNLEKVADLQSAYTHEDEQHLLFMVEALLQARQVIDDTAAG